MIALLKKLVSDKPDKPPPQDPGRQDPGREVAQAHHRFDCAAEEFGKAMRRAACRLVMAPRKTASR